MLCVYFLALWTPPAEGKWTRHLQENTVFYMRVDNLLDLWAPPGKGNWMRHLYENTMFYMFV